MHQYIVAAMVLAIVHAYAVYYLETVDRHPQLQWTFADRWSGEWIQADRWEAWEDSSQRKLPLSFNIEDRR